MKRLFTIIFLIVACSTVCQGQADLTASPVTGDSAVLIPQQSAVFIIKNPPNEYKTDTIKIVMLICDTSTTERWVPVSTMASWLQGYEVRKITIEKAGWHQQGGMYWFDKTDKYSYEPSEYLSGSGLPLKNVIVWQTRPL